MSLQPLDGPALILELSQLFGETDRCETRLILVSRELYRTRPAGPHHCLTTVPKESIIPGYRIRSRPTRSPRSSYDGFWPRRVRRRRNRSCSSTRSCPEPSATNLGAKKLWSPRCDSRKTGAAAEAAASVPRTNIFGRSVRTTSRDYCPRQADGSPKYAYFSRCRCILGSTSCRASTKTKSHSVLASAIIYLGRT